MSVEAPPTKRRLLLAVIDGLGRSAFDRSLADGDAPTLQAIVDAGGIVQSAISPFPSLTPTCLATIVTGAMPDKHRIPSLCWFHRGEKRFVEYGSSFAATTVEGMMQTARDSVLNLNLVHLADEPPTIFEYLSDQGYSTAAINYLVFRGRQRHTMKHAYLKRAGELTGTSAVYGPDRLYFGELFGHLRPILPQFGKKPRDWSGAYVARWLMRGTETDFTLLYLGGHDHAAHRQGPDETQRAVRIADRSIARVIDAAGGLEKFIEDHALVVCADHGQTAVLAGYHERLEDVFADLSCFQGSRASDVDHCDIAVAPSNRYASIYRLHEQAPPARWLADRALASDAVDIVAFAEGGWMVIRSGERGEMRIRRVEVGLQASVGHSAQFHWEIAGDPAVLDVTVDANEIHWGAYPDAFARLDTCLRCINSGDVVVSAKPGWQFVDIGGKVHRGGSHGSLHEIDSIAPLLTIGLDGPDERPPIVMMTDVFRQIAAHFAVSPAAPESLSRVR